MKYLIIVSLLLVGGCTIPTYNKDLGGVEWEAQPAWHWIGCYTVNENPAEDGEIAFFILSIFPLEVGERVWFKNVQGNKVIKSKSLTKCED
tara:strand:- start:207 stop:479 length:273 start_codon:yes stop_codon:yes gene_type:complete